MCACRKFKLIWTTLDFGGKFPKKNMNEKNLENRQVLKSK